jgi:hypothetical protein
MSMLFLDRGGWRNDLFEPVLVVEHLPDLVRQTRIDFEIGLQVVVRDAAVEDDVAADLQTTIIAAIVGQGGIVDRGKGIVDQVVVGQREGGDELRARAPLAGLGRVALEAVDTRPLSAFTAK